MTSRPRTLVLALLDDEFARLGLLDPQHHIRIAIAGFPRSAIVDGLHIFDAKARAGTLPAGVDARYLLGIVKNVTAKTEGEILAELLYDGRIAARDRFLEPLRAERDNLLAEKTPEEVVTICADRALDTTSKMDRTFWLDVIIDVWREQLNEPVRRALFLVAARRLEASYDVPPDERHDAVRFVADRIIPLD